ncbi:MAG TPA: tyrosine-type recombinase/integrase [Bdellovibrionota bacterium]|nr:tyrosine-type recombinase/integrase [Bdellovibrionota bacterium]
MNIEVLKTKNGTVYKATVGSRENRIRKTFKRKLDAERWIVTMASQSPVPAPSQAEATAGPTGKKVAPLCFAELFRLFQNGYAEIQQDRATQIREGKIVQDHLAPFFESRDVSSLTRKDIQQYVYYEARRAKLKPATINKHHQVLHKTFGWAVKNGLMEENPAAGVSKLPIEDSVYSPNFQFLEGADLSRALKKVQEIYPKEFPILFTAACTGMRIGEVCALQRRDLLDAVQNPVILVRRTFCSATRQFKDSTKGGNARVVPASDRLLEILRPLAAERKPNDLLFFESESQAKTTRNILHKKWTRAQKLCGIEPRTVHALRHTYATQFLSHGGSTFALQRILGHSSAKITDKYSHFSEVMVERSRNVVQIFLDEK